MHLETNFVHFETNFVYLESQDEVLLAKKVAFRAFGDVDI